MNIEAEIYVCLAFDLALYGKWQNLRDVALMVVFFTSIDKLMQNVNVNVLGPALVHGRHVQSIRLFR